jgi:hypothetical protein
LKTGQPRLGLSLFLAIAPLRGLLAG